MNVSCCSALSTFESLRKTSLSNLKYPSTIDRHSQEFFVPQGAQAPPRHQLRDYFSNSPTREGRGTLISTEVKILNHSPPPASSIPPVWLRASHAATPLKSLKTLPTYGFAFFFRHIGGFRLAFILLTLVSFGGAALSFVTVYLVSDLINHAVGLTPERLFWFYLPAFVGCIVGRELLDYFTRKYGEAFATIYSDHLLLRFQRTLLGVRYSALSNIAPTRLQALIGRYINNVRAFIEEWFWGSSRKLVQFLITVSILYVQSPLILGANLIYFALFLALALTISARLSPLAARYTAEDTNAVTAIGSFTLQLPTIRRLGIEPFFVSVFTDSIHRKWERFAAVRQFHARRWLVQLILYDAGYITTLAIGVYQVATGTLQLGFLVLIKYAFDTLSGILIHLIEYYVALVQQRQDSALVRRELGAIEDDSPPSTTHSLGHWQQLSLTDARSCWQPTSAEPGKAVTIEVPSLTIKRGEKIGIVGPSGAGKTTILQMLLNLYPFEGSYLCDGRDIKDIQFAPDDFTLINNSDPLFALTLRENLLLGRPIAAEQLDTILKLVCADEFTHNLEARVGDPGFNLSSGQQQRIRLARGLLHAGSVVLLDEPFNGLDRSTKDTIIAGLRGFLADRTVILVTHNDQELKLVDTVYNLKGGRLVLGSSVADRKNNPTD